MQGMKGENHKGRNIGETDALITEQRKEMTLNTRGGNEGN